MDTVNLLTERQLSNAIVQFAKARGWLVYFTWRSDHSPAGYPDLTMVRGQRVVWAELKRQKGKTTPDQEKWLAALREAGQEAYLWRPAEWFNGTVETTLK